MQDIVFVIAVDDLLVSLIDTIVACIKSIIPLIFHPLWGYNSVYDEIMNLADKTEMGYYGSF